jgi:hypothetical protein
MVSLKRSSGGNTTVIGGDEAVNKANAYFSKWMYKINTPVYLPANGDTFWFSLYTEAATGVTLSDGNNTVGNSTLNITRLI